MANPLKKVALEAQYQEAGALRDVTKGPSRVTTDHASAASPARDLMAQLEAELSMEAVVEDKYPLKWTVLGVTLFCGLSWYAIFSAIF